MESLKNFVIEIKSLAFDIVQVDSKKELILEKYDQNNREYLSMLDTLKDELIVELSLFDQADKVKALYLLNEVQNALMSFWNIFKSINGDWSKGEFDYSKFELKLLPLFNHTGYERASFKRDLLSDLTNAVQNKVGSLNQVIEYLENNIQKPEPLYFRPERERPFIHNDTGNRDMDVFQKHNLNRLWFEYDLAEKKGEDIIEYLERNLRDYKRRGGNNLEDWFLVLRSKVPKKFSPKDQDTFYCWIEENELKNVSDLKKGHSDIEEYSIKQIVFINPENIVEVLTPFAANPRKLSNLINGEVFEEPILLNLYSNQLAEFFKRVDYNNSYVGSKKDLINWIALSFQYYNHRSKRHQEFKISALEQIINKGKNFPKDGKRIGQEKFIYDPTTKKY
jgi:hypothetical protein